METLYILGIIFLATFVIVAGFELVLTLICFFFRGSVASHIKIRTGSKLKPNGRSAMEKMIVDDDNQKRCKEYQLFWYDELIDEDPDFADMMRCRFAMKEHQKAMVKAKRKKDTSSFESHEKELEQWTRNYKIMLSRCLREEESEK